jgi:hypothetical protein
MADDWNLIATDPQGWELRYQPKPNCWPWKNLRLRRPPHLAPKRQPKENGFLSRRFINPNREYLPSWNVVEQRLADSSHTTELKKNFPDVYNWLLALPPTIPEDTWQKIEAAVPFYRARPETTSRPRPRNSRSTSRPKMRKIERKRKAPTPEIRPKEMSGIELNEIRKWPLCGHESTASCQKCTTGFAMKLFDALKRNKELEARIKELEAASRGTNGHDAGLAIPPLFG